MSEQKKILPPTVAGSRKIDWDAIAKRQHYFDGSAHEMFTQLFPRMNNTEMAIHLGVSYGALLSALHMYGFHRKKKCSVSASKRKHNFPYILMGFETEEDMWIYFIKSKSSPKKIQAELHKVSGRCFVYDIIRYKLYSVLRKYRRGGEK